MGMFKRSQRFEEVSSDSHFPTNVDGEEETETWVQILSLPLICRVTLNKFRVYEQVYESQYTPLKTRGWLQIRRPYLELSKPRHF